MGISQSGGGTGGAPTDAQYVVLAVDGDLDAERTLNAGTDMTLTDNGAGSDVTLDVTNVGTLDLGDDTEGTFGADNDFAMVYDSASDTWELVDKINSVDIIRASKNGDVSIPQNSVDISSNKITIDNNGTVFQCSTGSERVEVGVIAGGNNSSGIVATSGALQLEGNSNVQFKNGGTEITTLTGSTETGDGMTADPETATEDAFLTVSIGTNNYQIPLYTA